MRTLMIQALALVLIASIFYLGIVVADERALHPQTGDVSFGATLSAAGRYVVTTATHSTNLTEIYVHYCASPSSCALIQILPDPTPTQMGAHMTSRVFVTRPGLLVVSFQAATNPGYVYVYQCGTSSCQMFGTNPSLPSPQSATNGENFGATIAADDTGLVYASTWPGYGNETFMWLYNCTNLACTPFASNPILPALSPYQAGVGASIFGGILYAGATGAYDGVRNLTTGGLYTINITNTSSPFIVDGPLISPAFLNESGWGHQVFACGGSDGFVVMNAQSADGLVGLSCDTSGNCQFLPDGILLSPNVTGAGPGDTFGSPFHCYRDMMVAVDTTFHSGDGALFYHTMTSSGFSYNGKSITHAGSAESMGGTGVSVFDFGTAATGATVDGTVYLEIGCSTPFCDKNGTCHDASTSASLTAYPYTCGCNIGYQGQDCDVPMTPGLLVGQMSSSGSLNLGYAMVSFSLLANNPYFLDTSDTNIFMTSSIVNPSNGAQLSQSSTLLISGSAYTAMCNALASNQTSNYNLQWYIEGPLSLNIPSKLNGASFLYIPNPSVVCANQTGFTALPNTRIFDMSAPVMIGVVSTGGQTVSTLNCSTVLIRNPKTGAVLYMDVPQRVNDTYVSFVPNRALIYGVVEPSSQDAVTIGYSADCSVTTLSKKRSGGSTIPVLLDGTASVYVVPTYKALSGVLSFLPNIPIYQLAYEETEDVIWASAYGGFIYKIDGATMTLISMINCSVQNAVAPTGLFVNDALNRVYVIYGIAPKPMSQETLIIDSSSDMIINSCIQSGLPIYDPSLTTHHYDSVNSKIICLFIQNSFSGDGFAYAEVVVSNDICSMVNVNSDFLASIFVLPPPLIYQTPNTIVVQSLKMTADPDILKQIFSYYSPAGGAFTPYLPVIENVEPFNETADPNAFSGSYGENNLYTYTSLTVTTSYVYQAFTSNTVPSAGSLLVQYPYPITSGTAKTMIPFYTIPNIQFVMVDSSTTPPVMFLTTSTGQMYKYTYTEPGGSTPMSLSSTNYNLNTAIDINPPIISTQEYSLKKKVIYYGSKASQGVWRVPFYTCGDYTTCSSCAGLNDPYCGWCPLTASCTDAGSCFTNGTLGWIQSPANCPSVWVTSPQTYGVVSSYIVSVPIVYLSSSNILASTNGVVSTNFHCVITRQSGATITFAASRNSSSFSCLISPYIPPPLYQSAFNETVTVSLGYLNTLVATSSTSITLYDCTVIKTCSQCVMHDPSYQCGWCITSSACSFLNDEQVCPYNQGLYMWQNAACPSFNSTSLTYMKEGDTNTVTVKLNNSPDLTGDFSFHYVCEFVLGDSSISTNGTQLAVPPQLLTLRCPVPSYTNFPLGMTGVEIGQLGIGVFSNNPSTNYILIQPSAQTQFTVYNCSMALTCYDCASITVPNSNCGWCQSSKTCTQTNATCYTDSTHSWVNDTNNCTDTTVVILTQTVIQTQTTTATATVTQTATPYPTTTPFTAATATVTQTATTTVTQTATPYPTPTPLSCSALNNQFLLSGCCPSSPNR